MKIPPGESSGRGKNAWNSAGESRFLFFSMRSFSGTSSTVTLANDSSGVWTEGVRNRRDSRARSPPLGEISGTFLKIAFPLNCFRLDVPDRNPPFP